MVVRHLIPHRDKGISQKRRDPFSALQQEIDDLFENFGRGSWLSPITSQETAVDFVPRIDVVDDEKEVRVTAELPGMDEKDIEVELTDNLLTIKGEKKREEEEKRKGFYRLERSYGSFHREIPLAEGVIDTETPEASFKKGVLTVRLAKKAEAQQGARKIPVKNA